MSIQDWGEFDGYKFTGNVLLPERYMEAMVCFVLKEIYDDLTPKYENEIRNLKSGQQNLANMNLEYSFCDVDQFLIQQMYPSADGSPVSPLSAAKSIYFEIDSAAVAATPEVTGYDGTITVARDGDGYVVVSSTTTDFNNYTFVRINNEDTAYELTNNGTITIYVASGIDISVEIWNN